MDDLKLGLSFVGVALALLVGLVGIFGGASMLGHYTDRRAQEAGCFDTVTTGYADCTSPKHRMEVSYPNTVRCICKE